MRKAIVAGVSAVAVVATAFVVAPTVWSQTKTDNRDRDRRVLVLDGRGSAIGVSVRDLDTSDRAGQSGVVVADVNEESPAAKAGIREGDVIVEFDGERVRSARHFARLVQETADGRTVKTVVLREGSRQTLDVTPERGSGRYSADVMLPDISAKIERSLRDVPRNFAFDFDWDEWTPHVSVWPRGRLGVQLSPLTDQLAEYFGAKDGVLVSAVESESVAAKAGLKAGDVITSVNGRAVEEPRDVTQELRGADGKSVELQVLRDKKSLTLKVDVPEPPRPMSRRPSRPA